MKRIPQLRDLSEDHHHGLVLSRKAKKSAVGEGLGLDETWVHVEASFIEELEPHFDIEESLIGKPLEERGEATLAKRLLDEHRALRAFFHPGAGRDASDLGRFGNLLERHIRFEERELFEVAQRVLTVEELIAVAEACGARHR